MASTTEDRAERQSKVDAMLEDVPFNDLEAPPSELAAETPLTKAAVVHLRAAAGEVSRAYGDVHALLDTVERALSEPSGGQRTFSEEERLNLAAVVRQARQRAEEGMQEPIFERGRGERPHGGVQEDGAVPTWRLFDVLNVARGCLELAADAELENSYGVSPRTMFHQVSDHIRDVYDDTLEALDRDPEQELTTANNMLEEFARLAEEVSLEPSPVPVDAVTDLADIRDTIRRKLDAREDPDPSWWAAFDALVTRLEEGARYQRHTLERSLDRIEGWMGGAFEDNATAIREVCEELREGGQPDDLPW